MRYQVIRRSRVADLTLPISFNMGPSSRHDAGKIARGAKPTSCVKSRANRLAVRSLHAFRFGFGDGGP